MLSINDLITTFKNVSGVAQTIPAAWLRVTGTDATGFLQGQCTQELRILKPGQTTWALWLNIKGRVLAESLMLRGEENTWWLWSAHSPGESLQARLEDFIIADDVTVENPGATGAWTQTTLAGRVGSDWILSQGGLLPEVGTWVPFAGGLLFAGRRGQTEVWDWLHPASGKPPVVPAELGALDDLTLARGRIAAGVPAIPREFGPQDLPQEAGLEEVTMSFTKGCYLGQEIMARLHAMGQVRRRLLRVAGPGTPPEAGTGILSGRAGKRIGDIRAAVNDGAGNWIGLAMVNLLGLSGAESTVIENDQQRNLTILEPN